MKTNIFDENKTKGIFACVCSVGNGSMDGVEEPRFGPSANVINGGYGGF